MYICLLKLYHIKSHKVSPIHFSSTAKKLASANQYDKLNFSEANRKFTRFLKAKIFTFHYLRHLHLRMTSTMSHHLTLPSSQEPVELQCKYLRWYKVKSMVIFTSVTQINDNYRPSQSKTSLLMLRSTIHFNKMSSSKNSYPKLIFFLSKMN